MLSKIIIFFLGIYFCFCRKYPIYSKIELSKKSKNKKTIDLTSYEDYVDYIKKYNNVIAYFHSDWCEECEEFLPILDEASTYKIINQKWKILKIDCARESHICMNLGVDQYPTSEIYVKKELVSIDLPTDLVPLLELLYKLSTNPIVKMRSKDDFFKKYGYYSPIVEIEKLAEKEKKEMKKKINKNEDEEEKEDKNMEEGEEEEKAKEEDDDLYGCIKKIANTDFI